MCLLHRWLSLPLDCIIYQNPWHTGIILCEAYTVPHTRKILSEFFWVNICLSHSYIPFKLKAVKCHCLGKKLSFWMTSVHVTNKQSNILVMMPIAIQDLPFNKLVFTKSTSFQVGHLYWEHKLPLISARNRNAGMLSSHCGNALVGLRVLPQRTTVQPAKRTNLVSHHFILCANAFLYCI